MNKVNYDKQIAILRSHASCSCCQHGAIHMAELLRQLQCCQKALAVFADEQSWIFYDHEREDSGHWAWDKLGDFADPREFARLALEGE